MRRSFVLLFAFAPFTNAAEPARMQYPDTPRKLVTEKIHGVEIADPYRWLEQTDASEVRTWVEQQNALTQKVLGAIPGRAEIRARLDKLLDIGTISAPTAKRGFYFHTRRQGKQNQAVLYVRQGVGGEDRVLLDPNTLSTDGTIALDWWYPSRDGKLLAYGLSASGSEKSVLHLRDVLTGKDLPDLIPNTRACSLAWTPDGKGFYYTRYPSAGSVPKGEEEYNRHVFFHALGTDSAKDAKVFGEGRKNTDWPNVELSPDGRWLVVTVEQGWTKTEVYFKDTTDPAAKFQTLVEGVEALFNVTVRDGAFYVHTNEKAPRYKVYLVTPFKPRHQDWKEIVPEGEDVLDGIAVLNNSTTLACHYMHKAHSRLQLREWEGTPLREVPLPTIGSISELHAEWDSTELFYNFVSFTVPPTIFRLDIGAVKGEPPPPTVWEQIKTDIDFAAYQVEQVTYPSKDGTQVTMFLASKKGIKRDGNNPTLLYGYGGFNVSLTPSFSASQFLFLERGGVMAIANLRGGGEYGETWHQSGMLGKKQNVFDDFIAAAEWLIQAKVTSKERLAIMGGSNGGLLMGAALTQRPDLFRCVVSQVPLLDMLRYDKFLIAKLWVPEYGSADDAEQFKWLFAYSPYHRVKPGTAYPAVLFTAAETDTRVDALHARKMAALLQSATSSGQPILLRLESKAGHGAGKPRGKILDELTDTWGFIMWQLGMLQQ
jgi:prolyl oligopeptidase